MDSSSFSTFDLSPVKLDQHDGLLQSMRFIDGSTVFLLDDNSLGYLDSVERLYITAKLKRRKWFFLPPTYIVKSQAIKYWQNDDGEIVKPVDERQRRLIARRIAGYFLQQKVRYNVVGPR